MPDAEATRQRILSAAFDEFAAHGLAGARVDRIAAMAQVSKNLIYIYFDSKAALFSTVLDANLQRVYADIPFTANDLPGYAGRVFDFAMAHPDLMRLLAWSSLEQDPADAGRRRESFASKTDAITTSQPSRDALPAPTVIVEIMTLATAWSPASPFGRTLDPDALQHPETLRAVVIDAVTRLTK